MMIHTDGAPTIANAPARPDRILIDEDELRRRLDAARAEGYDAGFQDALLDFENAGLLRPTV